MPTIKILPHPEYCPQGASTTSATDPASTPQNAEPIPAMLTPLSVTKKVINAASL